MKTVVRTHIGKRREENQDTAMAFNIDTHCTALVVCDGMGGPGGGTIAADTAMKAMADWPNLDLEDEGMAAMMLKDAVANAHQKVRVASILHGISGMGTTLVGAVVSTEGAETKAMVVNVGDSRAYLFRGGELEQITVDHSVVAEMVAAGTITKEQARRHPHRNRITRCIGGLSNKPDTFTRDLIQHDVLLLCTDGLHGMIDDADIRNILSTTFTIEDAADQLVAAALEAGGDDNITVALWCYDGDC